MPSLTFPICVTARSEDTHLSGPEDCLRWLDIAVRFVWTRKDTSRRIIYRYAINLDETWTGNASMSVYSPWSGFKSSPDFNHDVSPLGGDYDVYNICDVKKPTRESGVVTSRTFSAALEWRHASHTAVTPPFGRAHLWRLTTWPTWTSLEPDVENASRSGVAIQFREDALRPDTIKCRHRDWPPCSGLRWCRWCRCWCWRWCRSARRGPRQPTATSRCTERTGWSAVPRCPKVRAQQHGRSQDFTEVPGTCMGGHPPGRKIPPCQTNIICR